MTTPPRIEGYWASDKDPQKDYYKGKYPFPVAHSTPWEGQIEFAAKLHLIEDYCTHHNFTQGYFGSSRSRLNGFNLGSTEFIWKNEWCWPVDLLPHYVEQFNVEVTPEFYQWVMQVKVSEISSEEKEAKKEQDTAQAAKMRAEWNTTQTLYFPTPSIPGGKLIRWGHSIPFNRSISQPRAAENQLGVDVSEAPTVWITSLGQHTYCDGGCQTRQQPIIGNRYACLLCKDFDLCQQCFDENKHDKTHPMVILQNHAQAITFKDRSIS